MKHIKTAVIQEALDLAELDAHIYKDYSGRAMYGAVCDGIVFKNHGAAFLFFLALGQVASHELEELELDDETAFDDLEDAVIELTHQARTDNMGHDLIVYFPGYTFN